MAKTQKPGEKPAKPGEYVERGPRGGEVPEPREVTIEPGDSPLPPTAKPNRSWERVGPPKKSDS
ncbi:YjzC family protein [Pseudenhygromyxa sp. WMMC2535]|uniref:YjzC family protein n=1 Tax=Pseudenhygromyxa sp. WMMC2535 TaxID=2712867 RepID=UPI0015551D34|nr:YjzC family protein [Pseudenhygromyxa sp. WMMC2535]NVB39848.1 YjzC family protein [Pseudenhygromyxa sp. WMMC2535]